MKVGGATAKVAKTINTIGDIAVPIIIVMDLHKISSAAVDDITSGTTRKTVETSAHIGSGWVGGYTGERDSAMFDRSYLIDYHH